MFAKPQSPFPQFSMGLFMSLGLILAPAFAATASAENDDKLIINTTRANQNGFELQWFSQISVSPAIGEVKEMVMTVDENRSTTFFELSYDGGNEVYGENDVNKYGERFDAQGAEDWAKLRQDILKARGVKSEIKKYVRPKSTLFSLTTNGTVQCIDAETGKTNWTVTVGKHTHPAVGISANSNVVGVVSGPYLFCLDAETGLRIWKRECQSGPTGGVAVSDTHIFVTEASGLVEAFPLEDAGLPPTRFISFGRATVKPHINDLTISWPSGRGYYNVGSAHDPNQIAYRLRADSEIVAAGSSANGRLFAASLDGKTYAMDEKTGRLLWEFSAGDPVSRSPVALGNAVFIVSDLGRLFKLNAKTGAPDENWPLSISGISRFVAASQSRVYFTDAVGNLIGLDQATGNRTTQFKIGANNLIFSNTETDRIYFGTRRGGIQCLRELANTQPYFHAGAEHEEPEATPKAENPFGREDADEGHMDEGHMDEGHMDEGDPFGDDDAGDDHDDDSDDDDDPFGGG